MPTTRPLRILTWHVHGNYLWNLTQVPHEFHLVTDAARSTHHAGVGACRSSTSATKTNTASGRERDRAAEVESLAVADRDHGA